MYQKLCGGYLKKFLWAGLLYSILFVAYAWPQAVSRSDITITCPADGSSIEVLNYDGRRHSYTIWNTISGLDIRVGGASSGTGDLDATNSSILKAGASYSDSIPGVYLGRIVCMSTTGATAAINVTETLR